MARVVLAVVLAIVGCGYRSQIGPVQGADGESEARPSRLAVLALESDRPEPWLDRILTEAMRRELAARTRFDFVDDPARADWVIRGRVRTFDVRSRSFSSFVAALEYALTLELDVEVVRADGIAVRLDPAMLSETDTFLASADVELTRSNRLELLRRLSDQLAARVADSVELLERPRARADTEAGP